MRANTNFLPQESKRRLYLTLVFVSESIVCWAESKEIMSVRKNRPHKQRDTKQLSREKEESRSFPDFFNLIF